MHKYFWISALVLGLDQLSKSYFNYQLDLYESVNVMPFLDFTLVYNYGAAFGFLADQDGWQKWFLLVLSVLISVFLARWILSLGREEKHTAIALSLILGGALGNVLDRGIYGYVIDFVDVYAGKYHFPAFNIADAAISVGVIILLFTSFRKSADS